MVEECKLMEKEAKGLEKDDSMAAIEKWKEAANCYKNSDKPKNNISCLEHAGKLFREMAKMKEDPVEAHDIYTKSSDIYKLATKEGEAEKVMNEAYHKFIESGKRLRSEAVKLEDIEQAEEKFAKASEYALRGQDEELSHGCWIDSGNQFRKKATGTENPREALESFKHAIQNYEKGANEGLQNSTWLEAADKFHKKGEDIEKTKKELVLAIDNYIQAGTLYNVANTDDKSEASKNKVNELCDSIGLPLDYITNFLETKDIRSISV